MRFNTEAALWSRVATGDGCWEWQGAREPQHGYGRAGYAGRHWYTHRLFWTLANGPIPTGMRVLHHCDNPPCVRTDHLYLGTDADNVRDRVARNRSWRPDTQDRLHAALIETGSVAAAAEAVGISRRHANRLVKAIAARAA